MSAKCFVLPHQHQHQQIKEASKQGKANNILATSMLCHWEAVHAK